MRTAWSRDYVERLYLPAAERSVDLTADDFAGARDVAAYRTRLAGSWHRVHVDQLEVDDSIADLGADRPVTATVALGACSTPPRSRSSWWSAGSASPASSRTCRRW